VGNLAQCTSSPTSRLCGHPQTKIRIAFVDDNVAVVCLFGLHITALLAVMNTYPEVDLWSSAFV